jgi:ribosomal protein S12 methylthiotransferase
VKEVNLIAQDTTMYGRDLPGGFTIEDLLERLTNVPGIQWIRLLYCHPGGITDRLLSLMESEEAICPYLDLPFQHVNEVLLKTMGRNPGEETPRQLMKRIRRRTRHISVRTTLMVGFPGETAGMFRELCEFVRETRFDHLGAFVFSPEKGAAASRLQPTVKTDLAKQRLDEIMAIQSGISMEINNRMVGCVTPVLIEGVNHETDLLLNGRTATMAPDVDGSVLINKGVGEAGEIMPVLISEAHPYDLVGEILSLGEADG